MSREVAMSMRGIRILVGAVVVVTFCFETRLVAGPKAKYEAAKIKEPGRIVGFVAYAGKPPAPKTLKVSTKEDVCHKDPIPNEELVVSDKGRVRWAVVSLDKIGRGKPFPDDDAPVVLDQKGCRFVPHVVLVRTKGTLRVLNSDGILHNVHTKSRKNRPLNKSMPKQMKSMDLSFRWAEYIPVFCDVHDWMKAWVVVVDHPYHVVTPADGTFRLEKVPVGEHTVKVWHETLGTLKKKVLVKAGQEVSFEFKLNAAEDK
jgi:plastocyanin